MTDTTPNKNNTFWVIVKIFLAVFLIGIVFTRTNLPEVVRLFQYISPLFLVVYVLLFLMLTLLKAWQYHALTGKDISYPQVLNAIILQNALSNYLATTAGIASYVGMFRAEHGIKISRSIAVFLLIKLGDLIMIWLGLVFFSFLVWQTIDALHNLIFLLAFGIGSIVLLFLLVVFFRKTFVVNLNMFFERVGLSRFIVTKKMLIGLQALSEIEPMRMMLAFALSAVYFMVSMAWNYTGYLVFDFPQDPSAVTFVNTLLQIVSYLPVQVFGGLGVTETSALYFWSSFSISQVDLASFLISSRLLFYLLNLLPLLYLFGSALFSNAKNG
jgi:uncharacterized membrane protein YbhN (UPF0104 family)